MAQTDYTLSFNRGIMSPLARNRADVKRVGVSAEKQMNWMPRAMGPMSLRPGLEYIADYENEFGAVRNIPFIFSNSDFAIIAITDEYLTVLVNETPITRVAVDTAVTNGTFDTDLASWTDADEGTAASTWSSGSMSLVGTGSQRAMRTQTLTVSSTDDTVEHALRIVITEGSVILRVGTTSDLDDLVSETLLRSGHHSIAFTPGDGNTSVYLSLANRSLETALVDSCTIESAGVMSFSTTLLPDETLDELRYAQSGDIVFVARGLTRQPVQIERRSTTSWSLVNYRTDDGPYLPENLTEITLTSSALTSTTTITASQPIFKSDNVGSIYSLTSTGQTRTASLGALDDVTSSIKVTGIDNTRIFDIDITGTWTATIDLEQSVGEEGSWTTVASYTANQDITYDDGLDNQIVYYRLKVSAYTSGTATGTLFIKTGQIKGVVRMTTFTNSSSMDGIVLSDMGSTSATKFWSEGAWSTRRGFPSAVDFHAGRLYWAGKSHIWGSVVDDFYSFDPDYVGDAGPIDRTMGSGPVDKVNWLMSIRQLLVGAEGAEVQGRSNDFEEAITPTNFNLRSESTYGSAAIQPVKVDKTAIFIDRTKARVMETEDSPQGTSTIDLSMLTPELLLPNCVRMAVQRRPDTRVHIVRCDGTAVVLVTDRTEEVKAFVTVETQGLIEDVVVLPGTPEDLVYYVVTRVVDGSAKRYLEKWALESEAQGAATTKLADSFLIYDGVSTTTITGLGHLEGKSVIVWGNTKDLGTYTVASGSITLSEAVTWACVGLPYHALYVSGKLGYLSESGMESLNRNRRVVEARLILKDTHENGLEFGSDEDHLDALPTVEDEAAVDADKIWSSYDTDPVLFESDYSYDQRLVLKATAPRACTVLAAVVTLEDR